MPRFSPVRPDRLLLRRDDLVNLYMLALTSPAFSGVYNATAPNPVRMTELCSALGTTLGRPSWIPVPAFALAVRLPVVLLLLWCRAWPPCCFPPLRAVPKVGAPGQF